jgi:hypothetical protein
MIRYIETSDNINIFANQKSYIFSKTIAEYDQIKKAVLDNDEEYVSELIELIIPLNKHFKEPTKQEEEEMM